jgi:hypothetical protein
VKQKVEVERVLRDIWNETKTPLLIYATEDALNAPRTPLNSPLERFVLADNKAFRQELNTEDTEVVETRRRSLEPMSPSKRKHRADSPDSMDSNRASQGSVQMSDGDNGYVDHAVGHTTDLMDLSTALAGGATSGQMPLTSGTNAPFSSNTAMIDAPPATLAPVTIMSEDYEAAAPTATAGGEEAQTSALSEPANQDPIEESKGPEMQERARRGGLFARANGVNERDKDIGTMNMDIPDHQG